MRRRHRAASLVLPTLLVLTLVAPAQATEPTVSARRSLTSAPGANGRIVFARSPSYPSQLHTGLWTMASSGSDQQQVTSGDSGFGDIEPAYSPGGTMIAFMRDQTAADDDEDEPEFDIFVMQANGTGVRRLTTTATSSAPDWTPDGSRIVFASRRTGNLDIYSMKIDGTDVRRLTSNAAGDTQPSVSPDGKKIAFASNCRLGYFPEAPNDLVGIFDIYTMNIDGSGVTRLTTGLGHHVYPDWSPDGTKIAYSSTVIRANEDFDDEIFVMNADGSGQVNLTKDPSSDDAQPAWSPDGTKIAFGADTGAGDADIYVMAATGGARTAIGATATDETSPDWQPVPEFPLVDARFSTFKADIEWVYNEGITKGCTAERYCPTDAVTREQMAIFLDRALKLPATATDYFSDDTGRTGEAAINRVAAAGITSGCATGHYCPTDKVTRGAMASFLARAFALPATSTDFFSDDNGTTHESNINKVAAAGITSRLHPDHVLPDPPT